MYSKSLFANYPQNIPEAVFHWGRRRKEAFEISVNLMPAAPKLPLFLFQTNNVVWLPLPYFY